MEIVERLRLAILKMLRCNHPRVTIAETAKGWDKHCRDCGAHKLPGAAWRRPAYAERLLDVLGP